MKTYSKLITLASTLLILIVAIVLLMIFDVDFKLFKNLSIAGIGEKKLAVELLMQDQEKAEQDNKMAKDSLNNSKNKFDVAKEEYENIDESTIQLVQDATKEVKYFIEYLWIVLGNYASANDLGVAIVTSNTTSSGDESSSSGSGSSLNSGVKVSVEGRYANVADFVFDVENDKSLKFKLDNIKMSYSGNNKIKATFDVLSLSVLK